MNEPVNQLMSFVLRADNLVLIQIVLEPLQFLTYNTLIIITSD